MMLSSIFVAIASLASIPSGAAIPSDCTATYLVESGDSCVSIVNHFQNFTAPALYRWNPEIRVECDRLIAGAPVCINVPSYRYSGPILAGSIVTAYEDAVPRQPRIVNNCNKYEYTDSSGKPGYGRILRDNGITQAQYNLWNWPNDNADKDLVFAGYFSCVGTE